MSNDKYASSLGLEHLHVAFNRLAFANDSNSVDVDVELVKADLIATWYMDAAAATSADFTICESQCRWPRPP